MSHAITPIPDTTLVNGSDTITLNVEITGVVQPTAPAPVSGSVDVAHDGHTESAGFTVEFQDPAPSAPVVTVTPPAGFTAVINAVNAQGGGRYIANITLTRV